MPARHVRYDNLTPAVAKVLTGRNRAETEEVIGFFVNTLVIRTDLSGDPTFVAEGLFENNVVYATQDAGFGSGDRVPDSYDSLLGKVIAWAPSREQAALRLATALTHTPGTRRTPTNW